MARRRIWHNGPVLFFVVGLPGSFGDWCSALVGALAERAAAPTPVLRADTLEQIPIELMRAGASQAVIASNQPSARLVSALAAAERKFVVALDDPRSALAQSAAVLGPAAASRQVANSCPLLIGCFEQAGALVLHAAREGQHPTAAAASIARHLGFEISDRDLAGLVDRLAEGGRRSQPEGDDGWHALDDHVRQIAEGAIGHYLPVFTGGEPSPIFWTPDLFFSGDGQDQPAVAPIDITGRPRRLLHGPAIRVLPGTWSISLSMAFSALAAEHEFLIEISGCEPVQRGVFRPPREGRFEGTLEISVPAGAEDPIDVRLFSQRAAFDGAITLLGASLARPEALGVLEGEQVALSPVEA